MSKKTLRAAAIAAIVVAVLQIAGTAAAQTLSISGWTVPPSGRVARCPEGTVMIGASIESGGYLNGISPICSAATTAGQWTGTFTRLSGPSGSQRATVRDALCAQNSAVIGMSGKTGAWIDSIRLRCRPLDYRNHTSGSVTTLASLGGSNGDFTGNRDCSSGKAVVEVSGRTDWYVNSVYMVCDPAN